MNRSGQEVKGPRKWLAISLCVVAGLALAYWVGRSALDDLAALQRPGSAPEVPASSAGGN